MPMPVSARRLNSMLSLSANPVVSTMTAVAATAVPWPDSHGRVPTAKPTSSATATEVGPRPSRLPTAQATRTPSTAAPTWRAPCEKVR